MFLNRLSKKEKNAFLELAYFVAKCDEDFSNTQKVMIEQYCIEMGIDNIKFNEKKFNIKDTLKTFKSTQSRNIVLLEVMAIVYSDNILHVKEEKIINSIIKEFKLSLELFAVYGEWTKAMMSLSSQGEALLRL